MHPKKIKEDIFWVGAVDWDRRLYDALIPLPDGTTYNAYLIRGTEKTALIDTVDPTMTGVLLSQLEEVEDVHYVVSLHSEQDHSGAIPGVLSIFPNAKVITNPKGKGLLIDHLHIPEENIITVADGETVTLGNKTLEFIYMPWVHWPETMVAYLREDRIIFTCDLFGSHLATSDPFYDDESRICEAAKRYYAEVMMPFRKIIQKHLDKLEAYPIEIIAPSHGPAFRKTECIIQSHREWVSDNVSNCVVIPYVSMHGSTQLMVHYLTETLIELGVNVELYNLTVADTGKMAMSLVDAATIVIGSSTILSGAHPLALSAAFMTNALRPKLKFASIIGSYGWGGKMVEQLSGVMTNLKVEMLEPVIVKGKPRDDDFRALDNLAASIHNRHKDNDLL
ncbi:MAG: FprA family A-type flavoprotein [Nitrospirae bacterium]|nr:FprA family A-type flavoprotein [Nitrospirota bacterium]